MSAQIWRFPAFLQSSEQERRNVPPLNRVLNPPVGNFLLFIEADSRMPDCMTVRSRRFNSGVDRLESDFWIFGQCGISPHRKAVQSAFVDRTITLPFRQGYGSKPSWQSYASENLDG